MVADVSVPRYFAVSAPQTGQSQFELTDEATLTVERFGQTYHISATGTIDGDGALRSQLESIVADAT
jgi:hypothetical protein